MAGFVGPGSRRIKSHEAYLLGAARLATSSIPYSNEAPLTATKALNDERDGQRRAWLLEPSSG